MKNRKQENRDHINTSIEKKAVLAASRTRSSTAYIKAYLHLIPGCRRLQHLRVPCLRIFEFEVEVK